MEQYLFDPMVASFRNAVLKDAAAEKKARLAEQAAKHGDLLRQAKKDAAAASRAKVRRRSAEMQSKVNRSLVAKRFEAKKALLLRRMEIRDEVAQTVRTRILDFTQSEEYIEGLKRMIKSINLGMLSDKVTVFLPEHDHGEKALMERYLPNAAFEIDKKITLGGCKVKDRKKEILLDMTIDRGFEDAMERFLEISKLTAEL